MRYSFKHHRGLIIETTNTVGPCMSSSKNLVTVSPQHQRPLKNRSKLIDCDPRSFVIISRYNCNILHGLLAASILCFESRSHGQESSEDHRNVFFSFQLEATIRNNPQQRYSFFVARIPKIGKNCRRKQRNKSQHLTKFGHAIQRMRHGRWLQIATLTKPNQNFANRM